MSLLGSVGQLYMLALLTLLFLGFGLAIWSAINHFAERSNKKKVPGKANNNGNITNGQTQTKKLFLGGNFMANNGWLKLAIFSFVGILISFAVLGLLTSNGMTSSMAGVQGNMNSMQMPGNTMTGSNTHTQHQQQGMSTDVMNNMQMAGMQGGMNMNSMQMPNMQMNSMPMYNMQGGMSTQMPGMQVNQMPMYGMQGGMNMPMYGMQMSNMPMNNMNMGGNDIMVMMQNMQMQMNQMQQQINMMNNGGSMNNSGSMSNNGSMGGSSGGGMGMMGGMM